ncbi:hypothetical protein [Streptomyces chrestomyceticus]|uniref:hypothetical protein n=1 Tax=Streptomyces chrestomyceticus TaxID=68185 RepID=UPI003795C9D6
MTAAPRVVFIGAAGEMCPIAVERFAGTDGERPLVLCDIRPEVAESLIWKLPPGRATARKLDPHDRSALRETIDGAALVLALDAKAREAGVPVYVGCGASPGMSDILAVDAASELDTVETRCLGGLDPMPFNGLARGLGLAVQGGRMTVAEAVDFMQDVPHHRFGSTTGLRHALSGMIGQVRRGESEARTTVAFLVSSAFRRRYAAFRNRRVRALTGAPPHRPTVRVRLRVRRRPGRRW